MLCLINSTQWPLTCNWNFQEEIPVIAMRWSKVLRTGSVEVKFMAVDLSTIMFTIERGQDIEEVCLFSNIT